MMFMMMLVMRLCHSLVVDDKYVTINPSPGPRDCIDYYTHRLFQARAFSIILQRGAYNVLRLLLLLLWQ